MLKREMQTEVHNRQASIAFPIYRKHRLGLYTTYTRIDKDLRSISITPDKNGQLYSLEIEEEYVLDSPDLDYRLGRGAYQSSREEFQAVLKNLRTAIDAMDE